jgi:hypothetical protein
VLFLSSSWVPDKAFNLSTSCQVRNMDAFDIGYHTVVTPSSVRISERLSSVGGVIFRLNSSCVFM